MKSIFIFTLLFFSAAQGTPQCASKNSEITNIQSLLKKVNIFGKWSGIWDGKAVLATFAKNTSGQFAGKVNYDGAEYGPKSVKICDDNGDYYAEVMGYQIHFEVITKNKIKGYSPFDSADSAILTRK